MKMEFSVFMEADFIKMEIINKKVRKLMLQSITSVRLSS
jgi:hypothetical protein